MLEAVRIPDRDRELPDAHLARGPEHGRGRRSAAQANHRDIGVRIVADEIGLAARAVGERRADAARAVHHVAVGEEKPIRRKSEARAAAAAPVERDFEMRDGRRYRIDRADHRDRIGVEQAAIIRRRAHAGRAALAFVQQELGNGFQDRRRSTR